jgi:hypothetical protein
METSFIGDGNVEPDRFVFWGDMVIPFFMGNLEGYDFVETAYRPHFHRSGARYSSRCEISA